MSIYATGWTIKVPLPGYSFHAHDRDFVEVFAQFVPAHIGQPSEGYETDPYADFLPPIVPNYDPCNYEGSDRAIVVVQRGRHGKGGPGFHPQQYEDPVLVMSCEEYDKMPFAQFLDLILKGVKKL